MLKTQLETQHPSLMNLAPIFDSDWRGDAGPEHWPDKWNGERWGRVVETLGERFEGADLSEIETADKPGLDESLRIIREYEQSLSERIEARTAGNLVLYGDPGTLKTTLMAGVASSVIQNHDQRLAWIDGQTLLDQIDAGQLTHEEFELMASGDVLVLRNPIPLVGKFTPEQTRTLYRLLDIRQSNRLPTLAILAGQGTSCYPESVADRFFASRLGAFIAHELFSGATVVRCRRESQGQ